MTSSPPSSPFSETREGQPLKGILSMSSLSENDVREASEPDNGDIDESKIKQTPLDVYNEWLSTVKARNKEMRRLNQRKLKAQTEAEKLLRKAKKIEADKKVQQWELLKEIEAEEKRSRLVGLGKELDQRFDAKEKPKQFKKAITFQEWLKIKNQDAVAPLKKQKAYKNKQQSCSYVDNYETRPPSLKNTRKTFGETQLSSNDGNDSKLMFH